MFNASNTANSEADPLDSELAKSVEIYLTGIGFEQSSSNLFKCKVVAGQLYLLISNGVVEAFIRQYDDSTLPLFSFMKIESIDDLRFLFVKNIQIKPVAA